ncbi:MAG: S-methyl-5'-thioadenosine phosphorylase, partial [bacterium]|nr:S-methyl-5'-thioadenosine phosphorylase [bacterium]
GYPEVTLARELELCYTSIALVADYDVGMVVREKMKPVSTSEVIKIFKENNDKTQKLVLAMIKKISNERKCVCVYALEGAKI